MLVRPARAPEPKPSSAFNPRWTLLARSPYRERMQLLPSASEMWRAVLARDAGYDGVFVLAVRTTGIYCRPSCPARKPKRENVAFFERPDEAERAGFRACKRCRPDAARGEEPEFVRRAIELARARDARVTDRDLRVAGLSPSRLRRYFVDVRGQTFQAWQRAERLGRAHAELAGGAAPGAVALDSGFESESGFRDAFRKLFGTPPGRAREARPIVASLVTSPLGPLFACAADDGLVFCEFHDRRALASQAQALERAFAAAVVPGENDHLRALARELDEYFAGRRRAFTVPLAIRGSAFQEAVWRGLLAIPYGETRSYEELARAIGRPGSSRAVGRANGTNRLAIVVPCHRVVQKDGSLGGYGGRLWRKRALLALERGATPVDRARRPTRTAT